MCGYVSCFLRHFKIRVNLPAAPDSLPKASKRTFQSEATTNEILYVFCKLNHNDHRFLHADNLLDSDAGYGLSSDSIPVDNFAEKLLFTTETAPEYAKKARGNVGQSYVIFFNPHLIV